MRAAQDHPRSRGVYPDGVPTVGEYSGIIPARAGFTRRRVLPVRPRRDHPRSRGVYAARRLSWRVRVGSSPLARGLLLIPVDLNDGRRIIPARAGFTSMNPIQAVGAGDHPRSRGVYAAVESAFAVASGSSPLARGLRSGASAQDGGHGIIPARAGFTLTSYTLPP